MQSEVEKGQSEHCLKFWNGLWGIDALDYGHNDVHSPRVHPSENLTHSKT